MHDILTSLASGASPRIEYVFRHAPPPSRLSDGTAANIEQKKTYLSGYGVALDLKKTDYLAVDDRGRRAHASGECDLWFVGK